MAKKEKNEIHKNQFQNYKSSINLVELREHIFNLAIQLKDTAVQTGFRDTIVIIWHALKISKKSQGKIFIQDISNSFVYDVNNQYILLLIKRNLELELIRQE